MTAKLQAKLSALVTAAFGFVAWLIALPPELQTGILGRVVSICPPAWQPGVGFWAKGIATVSGIWAVYKASHSGPQPTINPPNK